MLTNLNQAIKLKEIKAKALELVPVITMGVEPNKPQDNYKFSLNKKVAELLNLDNTKEIGIISDSDGFYFINMNNVPEQLKKDLMKSGMSVTTYNKGTRTISNKPKYLEMKKFYDLGEVNTDQLDGSIIVDANGNPDKTIREEKFFIAYKILSEEFQKSNIFVALLKLTHKNYIEKLNKDLELNPESINFVVGEGINTSKMDEDELNFYVGYVNDNMSN